MGRAQFGVNYPLASLWVALLLVGCSGSSKTVYHTLSGSIGGGMTRGGQEGAVLAAPAVKSLGIGPVKLPALLDRQGLVLREDAVTIAVSDQHLWGGELEDEFLAALSQQLQDRLPGVRMQRVPWELEQTPQYQLVVMVTQFDGTPGGFAYLRGRWELLQGRSGRLVKTGKMDWQEKTTRADIAELVAAQARLLGRLATQLAEAVAH